MYLLHLSGTQSEQHKKRVERVIVVVFQVGNIVFPTHITHTETPYCPPHSQKIANAIIWLRAYPHSKSAAEIRQEKYRCWKMFPHGCHCLQQAVWHNSGCNSLENTTKKKITWLVASVGSPPLRQAAGR